MILDINKATVHILDPNVDGAMCSETLLPLHEENVQYLANHFTKCFTGEESRTCHLSDDSTLAPLLWNLEDNFLPNTIAIANEWFTVLHQNPAVPAADVVFALLLIDGTEYLGALKLNHKNGYTHYFTQDPAGAVCNELVRQNAILPGKSGKADEAFFINLSTKEVRVVEKKYEIDGRKIAYLSARILGCKAGLSSKEKLGIIQRAAVEVNQQFYGNTGVDEPELAAAVCSEFHAREEKTDAVPVKNICEKLYSELPHAREAFTKILQEQEMSIEDEIPVTNAAVRRLEKQSLRSGSGVEVKVPVSVYRNEDAIEFIRNEDGTMSLLIKNILV